MPVFVPCFPWYVSEPALSSVGALYVCQGEDLGYPQLPLFHLGIWDSEVVWGMYHFTPFSTKFWGLSLIGTRSHHPPYGGVVGLSCAPRGLELGYLGTMVSRCVGTTPRLLGSCSARSGE